MRSSNHSQPKRVIESGVTVYGSGNLSEVTSSKADEVIIEDTVAAYNALHKRRPFGPRPEPDATHLHELALARGVHPHDPVTRLAKAALPYSEGFLASVDTTKSMISWQATEKAAMELERLTGRNTFGFIFIVERQEDQGNERILQLREGVSKLAVPTLVILTSEGEIPPQAFGGSGETPTDPGPGTVSLD